GMIIRALMDDRISALDAKTGNQVWETKSPDPAVPANGYAMTGAPLIVNGVVIVGVAGAEFSNRGFIEGYDAATGKHLWRTYPIPAKGEPGSETWPGDSELTGGGSSWVTGTYDPDLDLVFWGVGNPAPDWNGDPRNGDNLYTCSLLALDADTGRLRWYFQFTPHDTHDWDSNHVPILFDTKAGDRKRRLVAIANRNAFYYVLDPVTREFVAGRPYAK